MMKEIPYSSEREGHEGPFVLTYTDKGPGGMGGHCPPAHVAFYFDTEDKLRDWVKLNRERFGMRPKMEMFKLRTPT